MLRACRASGIDAKCKLSWLSDWHWTGLIGFAVFYLLTSPGGAAALVTHGAQGLSSAARSLASLPNSR
jgi:hypothetical protein